VLTQAQVYEKLCRSFPGIPARNGFCIVGERHHDVFNRTRPGEQIEGLKYEPDLAVSHQRPLIAGKCSDVLSIQPIVTGTGPVKTAQDIHEGGFSRARRAYQGHEFAPGNPKRNAAKHRHFDLAHVIGFLNILEFYKFHLFPNARFFEIQSAPWGQPPSRRKYNLSKVLWIP